MSKVPTSRYSLSTVHCSPSTAPGITSPASLAFRHEERLLQTSDWETTYLQVILPRKLAMEGEYLAKRTLTSDMALILRTVLALFR